MEMSHPAGRGSAHKTAGGWKQPVCVWSSPVSRFQTIRMNLSDALDWPSDGNNQSGGLWPSNNSNPTWPGQPATNPTWPGGNPSQPAAPQNSLVVPYKQTLPQGIYDKLLITIAGTIKPNAKMITLDFLAGNDLAFHFNPRFNEDGKKVIVRNSCVSTKWGKEERELQQFPFVQGQPFEMKILCTNNEFKVAINNSHLLEFKHRFTNLRAINVLHIYNDLTLSNVQMQTLS
uniref:Galectin n=1 Tax=Nothobranchius furzeri TaxID=105023 RepID=A0A1A7Z7F6_NOTFU